MIEITRYRHYKGGLYDVLMIGTHSETLEKYVVYKSVHNGEVWIRPLVMFEEEVLINGNKIKRFTKVL